MVKPSGNPSKLPEIGYREAVRAFEAAGFAVHRQKGSHIVMVKPGSPVNLTVPAHPTLAAGTLRSLIRTAGLTVSEFVALLN